MRKHIKELTLREIFSVEEIIPSAGQGIISLQCREDDNKIISLLKKVNHNETHQRAIAERNVLKVLEGDCETAVGAHAVVQDEKITNINDFKKIGLDVGETLKIKSKNSYKK